MTLRQYIFFLLLGTVIAGAAWFMVLTNIDPASASGIAFAIFYLTLFIAVSGFFTSLGTIARSLVYKKRPVEEIVTVSLRQGILLAALIVTALILLSVQLLVWWTLLISVVVVALIEFTFLSIKSKNR